MSAISTAVRRRVMNGVFRVASSVRLHATTFKSLSPHLAERGQPAGASSLCCRQLLIGSFEKFGHFLETITQDVSLTAEAKSDIPSKVFILAKALSTRTKHDTSLPDQPFAEYLIVDRLTHDTEFDECSCPSHWLRPVTRPSVFVNELLEKGQIIPCQSNVPTK